MLWASYHLLAFCHKDSLEKLHLVLCLHKSYQDSNAAQEAQFDTSHVGVR